ncbi:hypothetical protein [Nocardioides marmoraquaticus]
MNEQDRVRRLLGDLGATDDTTPPAMPADLAARLDDRLAELSRERVTGHPDPAADPPPGPTPGPSDGDAVVLPLRRRLAPVLVAAALVLATGGAVVALRQLGDGTGSNDSAAGGSSAAGSTADESSSDGGSDGGNDGDATGEPEALDAPSPDDGAGGGSGDSDGGSDGGSDSGSGTRMTPAPYLTAAGFAADARALVRDGEVATGSDAEQDATERDRVEGSGCAVPPADRGAATLVSLDGDPAVLVVGEARGDEQVVELRGCLGRVLDETTVPAR